MTLADILDAYRGLQQPDGLPKKQSYGLPKKQSYGLPEMRLAEVRIDPIAIPADALDPAAGAARLAQEIAAFAPNQGWLCYQSAVVAFPPGGLPEADADRGLILSGELTNTAKHSLHIRQDGRGGWHLTRFTPGAGDAYLVDDHCLIAHGSDPQHPRRLHYRRYWTQDDQHGIRQAAACFIGFDGDN